MKTGTLVLGFILIAAVLLSMILLIAQFNIRHYGKITENAVWNISKGDEGRIIDEWHKYSGRIDMLAALMKRCGAGEEAVRAMKMTGGEGYLSNITKIDGVDIALFIIPSRANNNMVKCLVNGRPPLISLENMISDYKIDIKKDPAYKDIEAVYPKADIWAESGRITLIRKIKNEKGLFLTFDYPLLNGYHAAEEAGQAEVEVDFDKKNNLKEVKLIKLLGPGGSMPGGYSDADLEDEDVAKAYAYAVSSPDVKKYEPSGIISASRQVVAGLNYRLTAEAKKTPGGKPVILEIIVYRDLKDNYRITSIKETGE